MNAQDEFYNMISSYGSYGWGKMFDRAIKEAKAEAWKEGFNMGMFPTARFTYEELIERNPYATQRNLHNVTDFMECSG